MQKVYSARRSCFVDGPALAGLYDRLRCRRKHKAGLRNQGRGHGLLRRIASKRLPRALPPVALRAEHLQIETARSYRPSDRHDMVDCNPTPSGMYFPHIWQV